MAQRNCYKRYISRWIHSSLEKLIYKIYATGFFLSSQPGNGCRRRAHNQVRQVELLIVIVYSLIHYTITSESECDFFDNLSTFAESYGQLRPGRFFYKTRCIYVCMCLAQCCRSAF